MSPATQRRWARIAALQKLGDADVLEMAASSAEGFAWFERTSAVLLAEEETEPIDVGDRDSLARLVRLLRGDAFSTAVDRIALAKEARDTESTLVYSLTGKTYFGGYGQDPVPNGYGVLLDLLDRLDEAKVSYEISNRSRPRSLMVTARTPGRLWEIEVFEDGTVDVDMLESTMSIEGPEGIERLFRDYV